MAVFQFDVQGVLENPKVYVSWKGMTWNSGISVLFSNDSIKSCGQIEIKGVGRANLVGEIKPQEIKTGKTFAIKEIGSVSVGIKKKCLGLIQKIVVSCNAVECKGHELVNYRGIGVV